MPSDSRCGRTIDLFGQGAVPASHSAPRGSKKAQTTPGISGPNLSDLSPSAILQQSLENRLRANLEGSGSQLFALKWKHWGMQSGRPICALRASGRRTSGSDCGSWPTPRVGGQSGTAEHGDLEGVANLASWATPKVATGKYQYSSGDHDKKVLNLEGQVELASWPTPMAGTPAQKGYNEAGNTDASRKVVALASWATPTTRDHKDGASTLENTPVNALLGRQVLGTTSPGSPAQTESKGQLAPWPTPDQGARGAPRDPTKKMRESGTKIQQTLNATAAQTGKGQLNPSFSLWLMGYPSEWLNCAPSEMPSSRKSRQSSSKRQT